jgi:hypothetical protein
MWASSVVTFPTVAAHLMGRLMKYIGEDRLSRSVTWCFDMFCALGSTWGRWILSAGSPRSIHRA